MCKGVAALAVATLIAILSCSTQARATLTQVNVRIEGKSETLFEGPIWTEGHDVRASSDTQQRPCDGTNNGQHTTPGPTPTAAAVDAMSMIGETFDGQWYPGFDDYFITRWGPDEQNVAEGAYWGILVNDVFTNVGGCQYELAPGDEVLWVYDAFEERPNLALYPAGDTSARPPLTATAKLDQPFEVQVEAFADNKEDNPPAEPDRHEAAPYQGAEVAPVLTSPQGFEKVQTESRQTVTTNSEGEAPVIFTEPGWHRIKATVVASGKETAIRSNRLDVCVPAEGETGCGELPAEDQTRTPPPPELAGGAEEERLNGGSGGTGGTPNGQASSTTGRAPQTSSISTPRQTGKVELKRITRRRLLLKLTSPGRLTVQIARRQDKRGDLRWHTIKTLVRIVRTAGRVKLSLPSLPAGRYRIKVTLAGSNTVTHRLTVPERER